MRVVRDLISGQGPAPMDLYFNAQVEANGGDKVWSGSLCKVMDIADVNSGRFIVPNHGATVGLNIFGILEETVSAAATAGYLPNHATASQIRRKITPCFPSTLIRAEYMELDEESVQNYDTVAASAAGTTVAAVTLDTDDRLIGGWLYWVTGDNKGQVHYIKDAASSGNVITLATTVPYATKTTDRLLIICPNFVDEVDFNAIGTGILSDTSDATWADEVNGIDSWIVAPGLGMTRLHRADHDGNRYPNAKIFHDFTIAENSIWTTSIQ